MRTAKFTRTEKMSTYTVLVEQLDRVESDIRDCFCEPAQVAYKELYNMLVKQFKKVAKQIDKPILTEIAEAHKELPLEKGSDWWSLMVDRRKLLSAD